jgi:hypothetical protein
VARHAPPLASWPAEVAAGPGGRDVCVCAAVGGGPPPYDSLGLHSRLGEGCSRVLPGRRVRAHELRQRLDGRGLCVDSARTTQHVLIMSASQPETTSPVHRATVRRAEDDVVPCGPS